MARSPKQANTDTAPETAEDDGELVIGVADEVSRVLESVDLSFIDTYQLSVPSADDKVLKELTVGAWFPHGVAGNIFKGVLLNRIGVKSGLKGNEGKTEYYYEAYGYRQAPDGEITGPCHWRIREATRIAQCAGLVSHKTRLTVKIEVGECDPFKPVEPGKVPRPPARNYVVSVVE